MITKNASTILRKLAALTPEQETAKRRVKAQNPANYANSDYVNKYMDWQRKNKSTDVNNPIATAPKSNIGGSELKFTHSILPQQNNNPTNTGINSNDNGVTGTGQNPYQDVEELADYMPGGKYEYDDNRWKDSKFFNRFGGRQLGQVHGMYAGGNLTDESGKDWAGDLDNWRQMTADRNDIMNPKPAAPAADTTKPQPVTGKNQYGDLIKALEGLRGNFGGNRGFGGYFPMPSFSSNRRYHADLQGPRRLGFNLENFINQGLKIDPRWDINMEPATRELQGDLQGPQRINSNKNLNWFKRALNDGSSLSRLA